MSRKIIIISRDSDKYKAESGYPLSKLVATKATHISKSYLAAYDFIESKHTDETSLVDFLKDNQPPDIKSKPIKDFIVNERHPNILHEIPKSLIEFYKGNEESKKNRNLYDIIEIKEENDESEKPDIIFILYWNRTEKHASKPGVLLSLVCEDCQIDDTTDNLLYIHEGEWLGDAKALDEEKGDNLLIFESKKNATASINESILDSLIKKNFSFVASYRHVDSPGRFFHDILNMDFGKKPISDEMESIEKDTNIKDFISLKTEIESLC